MQALLFPKNLMVSDVDSHGSNASEVASEHSEALHPNEETPEADDNEGSQKSHRKLGCCLKTWVKLDEWILRDLLIYNYKPEIRKNQQMFFDMYDAKHEDLADIIKEAAAEDTKDDASNHSEAIRDKVKALKRRGTLKKDQLPNIATLQPFNAADDNFQKSP